MGILVEVNRHEEGGLEYLEIVVEPYPYPISYRGQYHYRSGSTKQELKGPALSTFLLQKQGKRWDGVPVPGVTAADLSAEALDLFRQRAARSGRVDEQVLHDRSEALLDNLNLVDGDYLKRAAVLLFHPTPEKFITGAYVKIGFFATDDDLRYQDEVHGPLLLQVARTLDLLQTKYTKAQVRYEGASRLEEPPFPAPALREALLNALAHKDYSGGAPVQISVYENHLQFWNEGHLPDTWTVENLLRKHPSKPFNPDVANTLFRAGYIESWGRGTLKILNECRAVHLPAPRFYFEASGFVVAFAEYSPAYWQQLGAVACYWPGFRGYYSGYRHKENSGRCSKRTNCLDKISRTLDAIDTQAGSQVATWGACVYICATAAAWPAARAAATAAGWVTVRAAACAAKAACRQAIILACPRTHSRRITTALRGRTS
nr:hypothetical protein [Tanacetum cinerariifolium]